MIMITFLPATYGSSIFILAALSSSKNDFGYKWKKFCIISGKIVMLVIWTFFDEKATCSIFPIDPVHSIVNYY